MSDSDGWSARKTRWMNRFHAWRAGFARPATGFVSQPEPRTIGRFAKGRQLCAGNFLFGGSLITAKDASIWDLDAPDAAFDAEIHGFAWLDDLAAVGDADARRCAQQWTKEWVTRFGRGTGPGWTPDLTGRRLIRWINHGIFLLNGQDRDASEAYYASLARQTIFLNRRYHAASPGLPKFEALTGLIYSGLALIGMQGHVDAALQALARECKDRINAEGGISTRNPEELLEVFTLLNWAAAALSEAGKIAPKAQVEAIERIAPTLRALRHSDGGLARFHGGGRGLEGRLDHALATSGVRATPSDGLSMGFARLFAGRTSLIIDASAPPMGRASVNGHASTLAIEVTSGRRPLIVNCGSGAPFGQGWHLKGRETGAHSTLEIDGKPSSRFAGGRSGAGLEGEAIVEHPRDVRIRQNSDVGGTGLIAGHDGYAARYGLTHVRALDLSTNGRGLAGEDTLSTISDDDQRRFGKALDRTRLRGVDFAIRFHLHPDASAELDMGGSAVSIALKSGEIWIFRHDGIANLSLEPSVFLEKGRVKPRATKQIVLSSRALKYSTRVRWTLAKAQETPSYIRDLEREDSVPSI